MSRKNRDNGCVSLVNFANTVTPVSSVNYANIVIPVNLVSFVNPVDLVTCAKK
jgi:hypothetical protein